jgi:hypothetical protein
MEGIFCKNDVNATKYYFCIFFLEKSQSLKFKNKRKKKEVFIKIV